MRDEHFFEKLHQKLSMSDLLQLPPHLLQRVANKFEWRSYFRMQQTCHDMADFIRTNPNVKVCLPKNYFTLSVQARSGGILSYNIRNIRLPGPEPEPWKHHRQPANFESLFGVRFYETWITTDENLETRRVYSRFYGSPEESKANDTLLMKCCDTLKKYRITSARLQTLEHDTYPREPYATLLKTLKPEYVNMHSVGSNGFEALLQGEQLKEVKINVYLEDTWDLHVITELLGKLNILKVRILAKEMKDQLRTINSIFQYLQSQPPPNLRFFHFYMEDDTESLENTEEQLEELFHGLNPRLLEREEYPTGNTYVFVCFEPDNNRFNSLDIDKGSIEFRYHLIEDDIFSFFRDYNFWY